MDQTPPLGKNAQVSARNQVEAAESTSEQIASELLSSERVTRYEVEPELRAAPPRLARYTRATQNLRRWAVSLFCALLLGLFVVARFNIGLLREVAHTGTVVQAEVTGKKIYLGKHIYYNLFESFSSPKQSYTVTENVLRSVYNNTFRGDKRLLAYLPRDPQIYYFGQVNDSAVAHREALWDCGIGLAGLLLGGVLYLIEATLREQRTLLQTGSAVVGVVGERVTKVGRLTSRYVTYHYFAGESLRTKTVQVAERLYDTLSPGTPFTVVVNPLQPEQSLPYLAMTESEIPGAVSRVLPKTKS